MNEPGHLNPCTRFQLELNDFLTGQLSEIQRLEAEEHLTHCLACLDLMAGSLGTTPNLTELILQETTGNPCRDAQLYHAMGSETPHDDAELALNHIQTCEPCTQMTQVMEQLSETLSNMKEMDPGPGFTQQVLAATLPVERTMNPWRRGLATIIKRPRFPMEFAYVAALLIFMIWKVTGIPHDLGGAFQEKAASTYQSMSNVRQGLVETVWDVKSTTMGGLTTATNTTRENCLDLVQKTRTTTMKVPFQAKNLSWPPWRSAHQKQNDHDTRGDRNER